MPSCKGRGIKVKLCCWVTKGWCGVKDGVNMRLLFKVPVYAHDAHGLAESLCPPGVL